MMTSIFTPVSQQTRSLKATSSTQEWCGHTYTQLNLAGNQYRGEWHSYFQDEADQDLSMNAVWLEDELWTNLRIAPESLPKGQVEMIPGLQYGRLAHRKLQPEKANAKLENQGSKRVYTVEYPSLKRKLVIQFEAKFPYAILGWEETDATLTTRAVRIKSLMLDYWNKNGVNDSSYRQQLGVRAN